MRDPIFKKKKIRWKMIVKEPTLTPGLHTHVHVYAHTNKDMSSTHTGRVGRGLRGKKGRWWGGSQRLLPAGIAWPFSVFRRGRSDWESFADDHTSVPA